MTAESNSATDGAEAPKRSARKRTPKAAKLTEIRMLRGWTDFKGNAHKVGDVITVPDDTAKWLCDELEPAAAKRTA